MILLDRRRIGINRLPPISHELRRQRLLFLRLEIGKNLPIFDLLIRRNRLLAVDDEAQRHRLHAPRRQSSLYLLPQNRANLVTDEPIQNAPRLLAIVLVLVDLRRIRNLVQNRLLADFLRQNPQNLRVLLHPPNDLGNVIRNRLPLAVGVCRQINDVGLLRTTLDFCNRPRLLRFVDVLRLKTVFDVDSKALLRQVFHMPLARDYLEIITQK